MSVLPHNARRNLIVLSVERKGKTEEGQLEAGSPPLLPGTMVEVVPGSQVNGQNRFTYRAFTPGTVPGMWGVLEEDKHQGGDVTKPYQAEDHIFLFIPQRGDHINMQCPTLPLSLGQVVQPASGTGIAETAVAGNDYPKFMLREDAPTVAQELREVEVL